MSTQTDAVDQSISSSPTSGLMILYDVRWTTYEQLLADHEGRSSPRFTFDCGTLEITSPSAEHEKCNRTIALFVEILAEELKIDIEDFGSTTFRRSDLARGFEPDSCFYIKNEVLIRGKQEIDLSIDPPPDLVIEIDLTSRALDKLSLYAQIGVPEIWRYD